MSWALSGRGIDYREGMRSRLTTVLKFERDIEATREQRLSDRHRTRTDRNRHSTLRTQRTTRARQLPFRGCRNFHHDAVIPSVECSNIVNLFAWCRHQQINNICLKFHQLRSSGISATVSTRRYIEMLAGKQKTQYICSTSVPGSTYEASERRNPLDPNVGGGEAAATYSRRKGTPVYCVNGRNPDLAVCERA